MEICNRNLILIFILFFCFFNLIFVEGASLTKELGVVRIKYFAVGKAIEEFNRLCLDIFPQYNEYFECEELEIKIKSFVPSKVLEKMLSDPELLNLKIFNIYSFVKFINLTANSIILDTNIQEINLDLSDDYQITDGYIRVGKEGESSLYFIQKDFLLKNGEVKVKEKKVNIFPQGAMILQSVKIKNDGKNNVSIKLVDQNNLKIMGEAYNNIDLSLTSYKFYSEHFFKIRVVDKSEINVYTKPDEEKFNLWRGDIVIVHIEKPVIGESKREIINMRKIWIHEILFRRVGVDMQTGEIYAFYEKDKKSYAEVEMKEGNYNLASLKFPYVSEMKIERDKIKINVDEKGIYSDRIFIARTLDDKQKAKELITI